MNRIIIIRFSVLLISCGSKKVVVNKVDNEIKIDSVSTTKADSVYTNQNNIFIKESFSELEYKPLDTLKPMIIDGKEYKNTIIRLKQSNKSFIDTTKTKVAIKIEHKVVLKKKSKDRVFSKDIKKQSNYSYYILFVLLAVAIFVSYKYLKKQLPFPL